MTRRLKSCPLVAMAEIATIARPYAEAVFGGRRRGKLAAWASARRLAAVAANAVGSCSATPT
jgi:hypothetical protein